MIINNTVINSQLRAQNYYIDYSELADRLDMPDFLSKSLIHKYIFSISKLRDIIKPL